MRKFADKQRTDVSTTESTLILSGSSTDTRGSWPKSRIIQIGYLAQSYQGSESYNEKTTP